MLYNEAVKRLDSALDLLERNNSGKKHPDRIEQISKSILKAQEIVTELMVSLDFDQGGEIARNLFALYTWFNQELLAANISQDPQRLSVVRNMLNDLRSAWKEVVAKTSVERADGPVGINITG
jgi:flagellar protein FliS